MAQNIGVCPICHSLMELTRHHVLPRSKGGTDHPSNIQLACRPCHDELDTLAGVRLQKSPDYRQKLKYKKKERERRNRAARNLCIICGARRPKVVQLGIMQASEAARLCQRCAWQRERAIWHSLKESIAGKSLPRPEAETDRIGDMLRQAGIDR